MNWSICIDHTRYSSQCLVERPVTEWISKVSQSLRKAFSTLAVSWFPRSLLGDEKEIWRKDSLEHDFLP